jgi:hypothetical protein
MDIEACSHWYDYSRARDERLDAIGSKRAPWHRVRADDTRRARPDCISHILILLPCKPARRKNVKVSKRLTKGKYNEQAALRGHKFVPVRYRSEPRLCRSRNSLPFVSRHRNGIFIAVGTR